MTTAKMIEDSLATEIDCWDEVPDTYELGREAATAIFRACQGESCLTLVPDPVLYQTLEMEDAGTEAQIGFCHGLLLEETLRSQRLRTDEQIDIGCL